MTRPIQMIPQVRIEKRLRTARGEEARVRAAAKEQRQAAENSRNRKRGHHLFLDLPRPAAVAEGELDAQAVGHLQCPILLAPRPAAGDALTHSL